VVELRAQEKRILATLAKLQGKASVEQLMRETGLPEAAVMRTALTLQEKALIRIHAEMQTVIKLTSEGETYAKNGLPERRLVDAVKELDGKATLDKAAEKAGLEKQFIQIALGWTQRKKWLTFDSKTNILTAAFSPAEETDEKLLQRIIDSSEYLTISKMTDE
jgi:phenylalanyl-tRNA synthetase alpha chain